MSRDSRDGKRHESDDDRLSDSARRADRDEETADEGAEVSRSQHRHERDGRNDHNRRAEDDSRPAREQRAQRESSDGPRRSASADSDEAPRRHAPDRSAEDSDRSVEEETHGEHPHQRHHDFIDELNEDEPERPADPARFVSYDEDTETSRRSDDESREPLSERTYRAEPAHRPFRGGRARDAAAEQGPLTQQTVAQQTAAPWRSAANAENPTAAADPAAAWPAANLHPYDHARASLIGLSTALIAAIGVIVFLMINLSTHRDLAKSALDERNLFEGRLTSAQQTVRDAQTLADQRAREAQAAYNQSVQTQRLAQTKDQAYAAAQDELRRRQATEVQTTAENLRRTYVTQIRLAKQAWDRGDTNQVLQLLEPYQSDPARQKLRSFAWYYLWRAAHSSGNSVLRGHSDVVRQAVVTPDGSQIVTFADDGQLMVWDSGLGRKLSAVNLERNVPPPSAGLIIEDQLARRAGGLVVASGGNWAAAYGRDLFIGASIRQPDAAKLISDHTAPIISLAISGDGKRLASGDYAGDILVRDAASGRVLQRFHNPRPQALALSSDGGFVFAGMHDGGLFVWDTNKGSLLGTRNFGDGINSMALSPDASTLALALNVRDGVVKLWEPGTGRFRGDLRGHHDEVLRVVWSRDGKSLLTASRDQTACLWSSTGGLLRTFRGHLGDVETVAFSPDGQKVVSAGDDQTAILWNVDGGQPCDMLTDTPVDGWVSGLAFTPDSSRIIGTGSCDGARDSYEAYLTAWNLADNNRPQPLQTSSRSGVALAFSPDGRMMAVGESSPPDSKVKSRVRIWSLDPARAQATVPKLVGSIYSVAYSPDGRYLALGTGDADERVTGSAQIVEPSTGALRQKLPDLPGKVDVFFSADSRFLLTVNSSRRRPAEIRMWNPATGELLGQIANPQELTGVTTLALSPDGRYLLTGHGDPANPAAAAAAKIKVWDLSTRQLAGQFPPSHPAAITHLEFSRRGMILASGDMAGNVRLWDFASRKLMPKQIPSQGRPILHIAFDKLGERLAVAADEKCVRVWHIDSGRQLAIMELALGVPNVVRFSQDGNLLAAATSAGGLFVWDANTYKARGILRGEGNPAGQQGHGGVITCVEPLLTDKLLTGSVDKTIRVWDLKTCKPVALAFPQFNQAVSCMAESPDGRTLAVGTGKFRSKFEMGELVLCALDGRQPPKSISQGITPVSVAFSPDGNSLAVCTLSAAVGTAARTVSLIDLRSGRATPIASSMGHSVAFSPDGRTLAVGCTNGEIDLWPLDTPGATKPFVIKKHTSLVWSLAFSPDGNTLASGGADNNVVIWDVPTAEDLMTLKHNGMVEALRFSPDGRLLATAAHEPSRGTVSLWRAPPDDDPPQNTLRTPIDPTAAARPDRFNSGPVPRQSYPDPTAASASAASFQPGPAPAAAGSYGASSNGQDPQGNSFRGAGGRNRRAAGATYGAGGAAPQPTDYSQPADDRYNTGGGSLSQPAAGSTDPSVPLPTGNGPQPLGGLQPIGPALDGSNPSGGYAPAYPQGDSGGNTGGNGGRQPRPAF